MLLEELQDRLSSSVLKARRVSKVFKVSWVPLVPLERQVQQELRATPEQRVQQELRATPVQRVLPGLRATPVQRVLKEFKVCKVWLVRQVQLARKVIREQRAILEP
jgi:hypothetical protein